MAKVKRKDIDFDAIQFTGQAILDGYLSELTYTAKDGKETKTSVLIFNNGMSIAGVGDWIVTYPDGKIEIVSQSMFDKLFSVVSA
jgi:hypothetical protein